MPAPTPDQEKLSKLVNKFRGISQYKSIVQVPLDHAVDLLNVMVSSIGNLEKFRVPTNLLGNVPSPYAFIDTLFMFTQGNGTRQLFLNSGQELAYYTDPEDGSPLIRTFVVNDPLYNARQRYVSSNNLLFGVDGLTVWKWNGIGPILHWGLPKPTFPPMVGFQIHLTTIQQAGGTLTIDWSGLGPFGNVFNTTRFVSIGSLVQVLNVAGNPLFDGYYVVATNPADFVVTVARVAAGPNGPFPGDGAVILFSTPCANTGAVTDFNLTFIKRTNGVASISFNNNFRIGVSATPEEFTISGLTGAQVSFNGTFQTLGVALGPGLNTVSFAQLGPDFPLTAAAGPGIVSGGFTNLVGPRTWRFSWGISSTGEEGPASDISIFIPNSANGLVNNVRAYLSIPDPPVGYGIDTFFLYATEDGGGVWETVAGPNPDASWPLTGPGPVFTGTTVTDAFSDSLLDPTISANFINYPPPQNMKFVTKWQGRIFGGGMPDAPQDIVYSGYDQIYRGRPESSWPPLNRIRLAIGAEKLAGFGVLLNGVIAWDDSDKMYMFSGTVQDITTTQPVQIADQLEEEPWQVGLSSADSIQSTPRGVVWVGADMTVQIWNGVFYGEIIGPRCLSENFHPYMSRVTPSQRTFIQSAYFNWLERDWYVLNVAVDGSLTPNRLFFFDLSQDGADNLGIWVSDIACDSIAVKVDSKGNRELVASIQGQICKLVISSTSVNGVHTQIGSTTAELYAFWDSGYWQDDPQMTKMYRYGRLTTDQGGFRLISTVLNDETIRFRDPNPLRQQLKLSPGGRFAVNRRGRRVKFRIEFPLEDVDASILELYITAIGLSDI